MNFPAKMPTGKAFAYQFKNPAEVAAALNPEQPLQCFSANALVKRVELFRQYFPGDVAYAVKANPSPVVIQTAAKAGMTTFDVASPAEMALVREHAPGARLHYHNPVRSRTEVEQAWKVFQCKRYSVDEASELLKLREIINRPAEVEIAVRFRLPSTGNAVHDFSEKFGLAPRDASDLLIMVKKLGFIPVLTFHPGSQCLDPASWQEHIIVAAEISNATGVRISKLNVGGGFPIGYAAGNVTDLKIFFERIEQTTIDAFGVETAPLLECEPGRAIVGPSFTVLTKVKMVRQETGEVYLNDGIYGNLLESTQAPALMPVVRFVARELPCGNLEPFVVYGPTCDPLDRLPGTTMLPGDIAEGDFVEFRNLGAYGAATSTGFNGYGGAELLLVENL